MILGNELASEDFRRHVYLPECGQEYEVTLHTKRKQLSFVPTFTMQKARHSLPMTRSFCGIIGENTIRKAVSRLPNCIHLVREKDNR